MYCKTDVKDFEEILLSLKHVEEAKRQMKRSNANIISSSDLLSETETSVRDEEIDEKERWPQR